MNTVQDGLVQNKVALDFVEIRARLKGMRLPRADAVVGIATGGTVPASLAAYELGVPLHLLRLNFRAEDNTPQRPRPELLGVFTPPAAGHVLLVDDVSVSGKTLGAAKALLPGLHVTTLVMKGRADLVLFPEVESCVLWPWKTE